MSGRPVATERAPFAELLAGGDLKGCCASTYQHPAVRWLLGDELHPGGAALTRRSLELVGAGSHDRLLDVASGTGTTALLAAGELGCETVGVEYGAAAVAEAAAVAAEQRLDGRVSFVEGDSEALPFGDGEFDIVICECSLCTFPDKARAAAEMRRMLRPGGRAAISDVIADHERLPDPLRSAAAAVACVGAALSGPGYSSLLAEAGLEPTGFEQRDSDLLAMIDRVEDRLRGARLLGLAEGTPFAGDVEGALELADLARRAVADGALGYAIFTARAPGP